MSLILMRVESPITSACTVNLGVVPERCHLDVIYLGNTAMSPRMGLFLAYR